MQNKFSKENVKQKYSFLLLEVLIAISLLAVFAPWLMRLPIQHYRKQIQYFEELEKQRLADWTYSEIKEMLLQHSISWKRLPEFDKPAATFPLPNATLHLPSLSPKTCRRSFTLRCKKEKETKGGEIFRLYELRVFVDASKYEYLLLAQLS